MQIHDLKLPKLLVDMLENNEWFRSLNVNAVRTMMKGISQDVEIDFLKIAEIESETTGIKDLFYKYNGSENYGLASSKSAGMVISDIP